MLGTLDSVQDDKHITNIPVLAYIIQPVSAGLLKSFGASGRNFTGISIAVDPKSQVNAILQYSPKIRKITALYSSLEPNAVASVKLFEEAARQAGLELTHVNFAVKDNALDPSSIYSTIQEAKKTNPDLVYLPPDGFILKNSEEICKYLNDEKLPSFTGMEFGIEKAQTALFGVVASSYAAGQMGALLANKILYQGENPGAIPFEYVPEISFIVRSDTLRKTNFFPSINVVDAAKFIDGPMYADQKR
jgi:putative ABC transport system substrate-binding protein